MLTIYRNIKRLREEAGLSQEQLAKLTGYTDRSSIAKIEKGLVDLQQSKIELFASVFHVAPGDLMGWDEIDTPIEDNSYYINEDARDIANFMFRNPEYKVLFDATRKVKKEDIEFVKQMIDRMGNTNDDTGC